MVDLLISVSLLLFIILTTINLDDIEWDYTCIEQSDKLVSESEMPSVTERSIIQRLCMVEIDPEYNALEFTRWKLKIHNLVDPPLFAWSFNNS